MEGRKKEREYYEAAPAVALVIVTSFSRQIKQREGEKEGREREQTNDAHANDATRRFIPLPFTHQLVRI